MELTGLDTLNNKNAHSTTRPTFKKTLRVVIRSHFPSCVSFQTRLDLLAYSFAYQNKTELKLDINLLQT
jgi:hypothetical protein